MKKFLVIGNMNACTYKEVFPHFKNGNMWCGHHFNKTMEFITPYNADEIGKVPAISWFTNLFKTPTKALSLSKRYNTTDYPKYDNYDAINVDKLKDIPIDYNGTMGVPITVLQYLNSDGIIDGEFELIGQINHNDPEVYDYAKPIVNGKEHFKRILIKRNMQE